MSEMKQCFVISPIGEAGSEVRRRADQVLRHVIEPATLACGYEAIRADKMSEPGMITSQVIQRIVDDTLVIADLTGSNPNVFYELAIRHAIRKPLVQLIQKGDKIPFDVAGMRTVPVDHKDLDSVDEARNEIEKQIRAIEGKTPEEIDSPITVSIELQALKTSENPEQRSLAEFVSAVSDLRSDIAGIEKRLSEPHKLFPPELLMEIIERPMMRSKEFDFMLHEMMSIIRDVRKRLPDDKESQKVAARLEEISMMIRHNRF
ncbi:hypothetical protein [Roseiconus lacunae]|uniref:Nucleoside 2-deoxyribosyltransferase n=1 Tax=Roseiconus lacunae TaxID=2605694 RepID=A0ABT7PFK0_9BACT|nr:hypothetical protein [Roseiconus lacunae]MDM4014986.1 hypothetical protein [Roseiconus lacunae]